MADQKKDKKKRLIERLKKEPRLTGSQTVSAPQRSPGAKPRGTLRTQRSKLGRIKAIQDDIARAEVTIRRETQKLAQKRVQLKAQKKANIAKSKRKR